MSSGTCRKHSVDISPNEVDIANKQTLSSLFSASSFTPVSRTKRRMSQRKKKTWMKGSRRERAGREKQASYSERNTNLHINNCTITSFLISGDHCHRHSPCFLLSELTPLCPGICQLFNSRDTRPSPAGNRDGQNCKLYTGDTLPSCPIVRAMANDLYRPPCFVITKKKSWVTQGVFFPPS